MALTLADYNLATTYRYSTVPTFTVKPFHATRDAETRRKLYLLQRRRQERQTIQCYTSRSTSRPSDKLLPCYLHQEPHRPLPALGVLYGDSGEVPESTRVPQIAG